MLYLNGTLFTKDNYPDLWPDYEKKLNQIKKEFPKQCIFKTRRNVTVRNVTGELEPIPVVTIPSRTVIQGLTGYEEWVWSKYPCQVKDGIVTFQNPQDSKIWMWDNAIVLDRVNDAEQIYYLVEKETMYKKGKYILEDRKAMAKTMTSEKQLEVELQYLIYHPTSHLGQQADPDEYKIRTLAAAWGISKASDKEELSFEEIQHALYKKVYESKDIPKFVSDANLGMETTRRAMIQQAFDRDVIYYSFDKHAVLWVESQEKILDVPPQHGSNFFNFFCDKAIYDEKLMEYIEASVIDLPKYMPKEIDAMTYQQLQSLAYKYKVKGVGARKADLIAELKKIAC